MKSNLLLFVFALIVANIPSLASGQTKSSTPPPPPLTKRSTIRDKGKKAIPPAPPLSSIKSAHKKRSSSVSRMSAYQTPGRDTSGRKDLSGKPIGFYPINKGTDTVDPSRQQSAIRRR